MDLKALKPVRRILNSLSNAIVSLQHMSEVKKFLSAFQRNRKLPLASLIYFLLLMDQNSIPCNLRTVFSSPESRPSPAAVCKRRKLLVPTVLEALFHLLNKKLDSFFSRRNLLYRKKYRMLVCDGSDFSTMPNPLDKDSYFPSKNGRAYNMYHMNVLFNLTTGRYEQMLIHSKRLDNERASFLEMAGKYPAHSNTVFIMDRGYECWDIMIALMKAQNYFVIRLKSPDSSGLLSSQSFPGSSEFDVYCTIPLIYRYLSVQKISLLHPDGYAYRKASSKKVDLTVKIRVVKISKPDGEAEFLATNLSRREFSLAELKILYHKRWEVETSFRNLKWTLKTTSFHSKQEQKIIQEVWIKLILFNLCSTVQKKLQVKQQCTKYAYQLSFSRIVQECRIYYIRRGKDPDFVRNLKTNLLPIRPGRSAPRRMRIQGPRSFQYC